MYKYIHNHISASPPFVQVKPLKEKKQKYYEKYEISHADRLCRYN